MISHAKFESILTNEKEKEPFGATLEPTIIESSNMYVAPGSSVPNLKEFWPAEQKESHSEPFRAILEQKISQTRIICKIYILHQVMIIWHEYTFKIPNIWHFWAWQGGTGRAFLVKFNLALKPSHYQEQVCEVVWCHMLVYFRKKTRSNRQKDRQFRESNSTEVENILFWEIFSKFFEYNYSSYNSPPLIYPLI